MRTTIAGIIMLCVIGGALYLWNSTRSDVPSTQIQEPLPGDGIRFGFIRGVSTSTEYMLEFDEAQWLTGEKAESAAIAAGQCTEQTRTDCLPNDFFIENTSTTTIPLVLSDEPVIAMFTLAAETDGVKEMQISKDQFFDLLTHAGHWKDLPYQMLVEQGRVTIIEEVYVP